MSFSLYAGLEPGRQDAAAGGSSNRRQPTPPSGGAVQGFRQSGPGGLRLGPDEHAQNMCVLAIFATAVRSRLPSLPIFL